MNDLVKIARARVTDIQQTHWEGCERDHRECLIQRMADEIERLTAERDSLQSSFDSEWAAVERLHTEIEAVRAANRESKMLVAAAIDDIAKARSAMVALLGIVRNWREIILQQDQQVPEIWQSVAKLDAVIAQADAALGASNE